jgi:hypothetical protein
MRLLPLVCCFASVPAINCFAQAQEGALSRAALLREADERTQRLMTLALGFQRVNSAAGVDTSRAWAEVHRARALSLRGNYTSAMSYLIKGRREGRNARAQEILAVEISRVMASTLHTQNESTTVALGLSELGKELSSIDAPLAAFTKARRNHYRGSIGAASFGYRDALAKLEAVGTGSAVIPELGSQVKLHYAELLMSDAVLDTSQAKQLLSRSPARRSSPYVQVSRLSLGARLMEVRGQAD